MKHNPLVPFVVVAIACVLIVVTWFFVFLKPEIAQIRKSADTESLSDVVFIPPTLVFAPEGSRVTYSRSGTDTEMVTIILSASEYRPSSLYEAYQSEFGILGWEILAEDTMGEMRDIHAGKNRDTISVRIAPHYQEIYVYVVYRKGNN